MASVASAERGAAGTWEYLALWNPDGTIDLDGTLATMPASDRDAAETVSGCWPDQLWHVPGSSRQTGQWYIWNGKCQAPDHSSFAGRLIDLYTHLFDTVFESCHQQLAAEISAQMAGQAQAAVDTAVAQAWGAWTGSAQFKYARNLRKTGAAAALLERLAVLRGAEPGVLADRWPEHLNVANGILSLRDGVLLGHHPGWMMTYCLDVEYDGQAKCPEFEQMLWRATGYDAEVYQHLVKVLGYSLLGDNRHQLAFFLSGPTASGKSKLLEIVSTVLGRLAYDAKPALISTSKERHSRHEASLRGTRLVTIDETNDRLFIDEMQFKRLTGQGRYSYETLYSSTMTAAGVTWLIIIANNDMPSVSHLDEALRRRIWVIPMGPSIPEDEWDDTKVARICANEAPGVLGLLARGAAAVLADHGQSLILPPAAVIAKTREWEAEQDTTATWLAERCYSVNGQGGAAVEGRHAQADYFDWCRERGPSVIALGRNNFYTALSKIDGVTRSGDINHVWFRGFALKNQPLD